MKKVVRRAFKKSVNAYQALHKFYTNQQIMDIMIRLDYDDDNFLIMKGKVDELKEKYPETWNNICSCQKKADFRTPIEYARDIVSAWVIEDIVREMLSDEDLIVELNGGDAERKFLPNKKVNGNSDFKITYQNKTRNVELSNDYSGFVVKNMYNDLRGAKLDRLEEENALLLIVNLNEKLFTIIDIKNPYKIEKYIFNTSYGKTCSKVYVKEFYSLDILKDKIKDFILNT